MLSCGVGEVEDGQSSQRFDDSRKGEYFAGVSLAHEREVNLLRESVWRVQLEELPRHKSVLERISRSSAHISQIEYLVGLVLFRGPMVRIDVIG